MGGELYLDPAEVMEVCHMLRERYEYPTSLADAMDDPMPVRTGNPTLDSETTVAIQRLTERFDEFGEAMRWDATRLLQNLRQYGAMERAIQDDFDELVRALDRRAGVNRPVLSVPDPGLPPAAQRQLGLRARGWETVEPPVGAGCAYRLGEPEGIRALGRALRQAATGMEELIRELRWHIYNLVPSGWRGEGATAFKEQVEQQLRTGMTAIVERSRKLGDAADVFADYLRDAWVIFAEAQVLAVRFDFTFVPQRSYDVRLLQDACRVHRNGPDPQDPQAASAREAALMQCQMLVDRAIALARSARSPFRAALAESSADLSAILRPLSGARGGGVQSAANQSERVRARVRTRNVLRAIEEELLNAPRNPYGTVEPMPPHLMGPDGQPTLDALSAVHQQIVQRLQADHPGVRFDVTVTPDGAQLRVVGRAPGVRHPGFDYIQVIPDTPEHMRRYAQDQWGTPGFEGQGRIFTYDRDGRMYGLDLSALF